MIMNLFTACEKEAGVQLPPVPSFCFSRMLVYYLLGN